MEKAESILSQQRLEEDAVEFRRDLLLRCQVALLGEISDATRAIAVGWTPTSVTIRVVADGPVRESDRESMECVVSEVAASFPNHKVELEHLRHDAPTDFRDLALMAWVYCRKER